MGRLGGRIPGRGPRGVERYQWGTQNAQQSRNPGPEGRGNQGSFQDHPPPSTELWGRPAASVELRHGGLSGASYFPHPGSQIFGTNICSAVHRKRANWQARRGQTLAQATHRAEAVIHVLKPFPLLSLVTGPPDLIWAPATQMKDHIPQFPLMLN